MSKESRDKMLYKIGHVKEMEQIKGIVPEEVYQAVLHIVTVLDDNYGADRAIDGEDGGFILVATDISDITAINEEYIRLETGAHEYSNIVKCAEGEPYINTIYICNNETSVNIFTPKSITPKILLADLEQ